MVEGLLVHCKASVLAGNEVGKSGEGSCREMAACCKRLVRC